MPYRINVDNQVNFCGRVSLFTELTLNDFALRQLIELFPFLFRYLAYHFIGNIHFLHRVEGRKKDLSLLKNLHLFGRGKNIFTLSPLSSVQSLSHPNFACDLLSSFPPTFPCTPFSFLLVLVLPPSLGV